MECIDQPSQEGMSGVCDSGSGSAGMEGNYSG